MQSLWDSFNLIFLKIYCPRKTELKEDLSKEVYNILRTFTQNYSYLFITFISCLSLNTGHEDVSIMDNDMTVKFSQNEDDKEGSSSNKVKKISI